MFEIVLIVLFGVAVASLAALVGLGGGFLIVPFLIIVIGLPPHNAVAVSLVAIFGTTVSATIGYYRQKRIDFKLGLLYDILDIPGVMIGAYLTTIIPSSWLNLIIAIFIISIAVAIIFREEHTTKEPRNGVNPQKYQWHRKLIDSSGNIFEYTIKSPGLSLISSFVGGIITGLCGMGGGITDTSTMILLGVPPHIAIASSEFAMALTNGFGVVAHELLNNVLLDYAIPLTIGTVIGAQIGASLARRFKVKTLKILLCIVAIVMGARLLLIDGI